MATFVLIHGGGDVGWSWHQVEIELRRRGHDSVAPDLPCDDESAGLSEYADAVVAAVGDRRHLVLLASRMAGSPRHWSPIGFRSTCWCWWPG